MYSTNKIVSVSTLSRDDHCIAQTRELACTKIALSKVMEQGRYVF